jgi:hypothetical protein
MLLRGYFSLNSRIKSSDVALGLRNIVKYILEVEIVEEMDVYFSIKETKVDK